MKMILLTLANCCIWITMSNTVAAVSSNVIDATENQQLESAKHAYYFKSSTLRRKEFRQSTPERFRRDHQNNINQSIDWKEAYLYNISDVIRRNHAEEMFELCPAAFMCEKSIEIREFTIGPNASLCCIECSCDPFCRYTNTCCPHYLDQAVIVRGTEPREPQPHQICRYPIYFHNDVADVLQYSFIASCPESATQILKDLCQSEPTKGFMFEDVTPLFDNVTVRNYMNRHCAQCNGVNLDTMLLWKPKVGCRNHPLTATAEMSAMLNQVIDRDDCFVEFSTPVDRTKATICDTHVIRTCNVTCNWNEYDDRLARACSVYPLTYVVKRFKYKQKYSNIFCALCNGEPIYSELDICDAYDVNTVYALLVSVKLPNSDDESKQDSCGADSLFDPLTEQCQTVYCTPPHMFNIQDKTCIEVSGYQFYGAMKFPARVILDRNISAKHAVDSIWNYLKNTVLNDMQICYVAMYFNTNQVISKTLSFNTETLVTEVMLVIYIRIEPFANANQLYKDFVQGLHMSYSFKRWPLRDEITMKIVVHGIDPSQQIPSQGTYYPTLSDLKSNNIWADEEIIKQMKFYEDPYSKTMIAEDIVKQENDCLNDIIIYDLDFLPCMTFTYNINSTNLKRVPAGLMYDDRILFKFGEFISLNDTHVIICVAVVQQFNRSVIYGYTRGLVVLLSLLTSIEIHIK